MKKILVFLLTVILALSTFSVLSFAATKSPEAEGVISGIVAKDDNDEDVSVSFEKIDGKVVKEFAKALEELKKELGTKDLKVIDQYDVDIDGSPEYPVAITLSVLGISDSSKGYVLVKNSKGVVEMLEVEIEKGKISFSITENIKRLAIVVDKKTAAEVEKENNVLAPQTGDNSVVVTVLALVTVLAAGFVLRKIRV